MSKMVSKRTVVPALIITGLLSQVSSLQAATIDLVFTTYTTSQCSLNCITFDDAPIVGAHSVSLDMSVINTYAQTTAYNNAADYDERLNTNIIHGEYSNYGAYEQLSAYFEQVFSQYGTGNSSMSSMLYISEDSRSLTPVEVEYTGNLPPAYQPEPSSGVSIVERQVSFYGTLDQGESPLFAELNDETIPLFLTNFYDLQFGFSTNQNTTICQEYNEEWPTCTNSLGSTHQGTGGYAYLESVSVSSVPVPAAVWLFGSGLIGLAGIARRKKK